VRDASNASAVPHPKKLASETQDQEVVCILLLLLPALSVTICTYQCVSYNGLHTLGGNVCYLQLP